MKRQMVCFCEHRFEADLIDEVDLQRDPQMEEAILAGGFLATKCPRCGRLLKPECPLRVRDAGRGIDLFMVPEEDRREYLRGVLPYSTRGAQRVVIGFAELVEKLQEARAGLDERAVEVLKYYLLNRALEAYETADRVTVLLNRQEGETLVFHLHGLKQEEVAVVRIPRQKHDQALAGLESRLREEPFDRLLKPPYVSINNLYRAEAEEGGG